MGFFFNVILVKNLLCDCKELIIVIERCKYNISGFFFYFINVGY